METREFETTLRRCQNKLEDECDEEEKRIRLIEVARCQASLLHFLKYVKILVPPTLENPGGIVPFTMSEHVKELIKALLTEKQIVIAKARQVWISTVIAVYAIWRAKSEVGWTGMLFSRGLSEAQQLLGKARLVEISLPLFLRGKLDPDSTEHIGFPAMTSSIKAFAATELGGVSYTASLVVDDEWAMHPFAERNYFSSKPTRDQGGQFIGIFTQDAWNIDNLATTIFLEALAGKNGFKPLFFPWNVVPDRNEQWYEETKKSIPDMALGTLTPELYMRMNYPATIQDILTRLETISVFDAKVLDEMMGDTRPAIKMADSTINNLVVKVYQGYYIGGSYIAATDVSHGVGKDYSVTVVRNTKTGAVVADIMSQVISPEELAQQSIALMGLFHNPLWFIENNDWGQVVITMAQSLGYRNFGYEDEKRTKIGFHTDEKSRLRMLAKLVPAINTHQIPIPNAEGIKQFYDIIRNTNKNGRIEAAAGKHDDYVVAVAITRDREDEVASHDFKPLVIHSLYNVPAGRRLDGS